MRGKGRDTSRCERGPSAPRSHLPTTLLATLLTTLLALTAAAHAQLGELTFDDKLDVAEDVNRQTGVDPDTDHTPRAKEEQEYWSLVAGARFGQREVAADSATSFATDLYAVSFANTKVGFAGGSECIDPETEPEQVKDCKRRPVIYRYDEPQAGSPPWRKSLEAQGEGYVGAIAWIDSKRALAVGGDGTYPRREHGRNEGESYEDWLDRDPAGKGRAWLYENGAWRELDLSAQREQGMRGMTALDFYRGPELSEFGVAGALGQLWHWENGRFTEKFDRDTDKDKPDYDPRGGPSQPGTKRIVNPQGFRHRVRELRFVASDKVWAFAVTAGCCEAQSAAEAESKLRSVPRLLAYNDEVGRWFVSSGFTLQEPFAFVPRVDTNTNARQTRPDSFYSLLVRGSSTTTGGEILASPGGPERDGEPRSGTTRFSFIQASGGGEHKDLAGPIDLFRPFSLEPATSDVAQTAVLSTARLVSGDGGPDTTADWSVGELRSTRGALGARGLAVATHLRPPLTPDVIDSRVTAACSPAGFTQPCPSEEVMTGEYEPTSAEKLNDYRKSRHFLLPSYSLNAIDVIDPTGQGWAVGDRGAILQLGEGAVGAAGSELREPEPPRLGSRQPARLADRSPYDAASPASTGEEIGSVPSLSSQPRERLAEPRFHPMGSPDPTLALAGGDRMEDVREIVMSRDGSEGWAIGPNVAALDSPYGVASFYHYDGSTWSRCDPIGNREQGIEPDPACASVAGLRRWSEGVTGQTIPAQLIAAARVPHENDPYPGNDDEFEIVAIGTNYRAPDEEARRPLILRYRKGAWDFEEAKARTPIVSNAAHTTLQLRDLAFTAPNDGWILADQDAGDKNKLFHYNGEHWIDCKPAPTLCGDADGRVRSLTSTGTGGSGATVRGLTTAGDRVYLFGNRFDGSASTGALYPLILHHKRGAARWEANPARGALDPGASTTRDSADRGRVDSLAVVERPDGAYEGWALGQFGGLVLDNANLNALPVASAADAIMLRLAPGGSWRPFKDRGALFDYMGTHPASLLAAETQYKSKRTLQLMLVDGGHGARAFIAERAKGRVFSFDRERERWDLLTPAGRPPAGNDQNEAHGPVQALAPDGRGGFWMAVRSYFEVHWFGTNGSVHFLHYTDRPHREVFADVPHPVHRQRITGLAGTADGSLWLSTNSDQLYRYDRLTGWDSVRIPGWDPGRVVARPSSANAVAVGPDGDGVAAGERGRIARIERGSVRLDAAAGTVCDLAQPIAPCGTSRDLRTAAIAPDGSAMIGGDRLALLWRPAGGQFRAIERPDAADNTMITALSMPHPGRAWLGTDSGLVFRGELVGGRWDWVIENVNADGDQLSLTSARQPLAIHDIAIDAGGRGYAVGDRGLVLERTGDGELPWRRLKTRFTDDLTSVALPQGEGDGALIGGRNGLILTRSGDSFELARPADYFYGNGHEWIDLTGPVVGLALLPGMKPGQAEAFVAIASMGNVAQAKDAGTGRLLHYTSDPSEPLLQARGRARPLPDAPAPRAGELSIAAFGKTECRRGGTPCPEMVGVQTAQEEVTRRVVDEIAARARRPDGPALALFTGDAVDSALRPAHGTAESVSRSQRRTFGFRRHERWTELVADRLEDAGVPLLGAVGGQDLSEVCAGQTETSLCRGRQLRADNLTWREAMTTRAEPWGKGRPAARGSLALRPVRDRPLATRARDVEVRDPDVGQGSAKDRRVAAGEARTHYAVDVVDSSRSEGEKLARIVVVDTSFRSLAASDPLQNPIEPAGGQATWLEEMLCVRGETSAPTGRCTREPGQAAIVVSNTPTYSYGPGAVSETQTDAAAFETLLLKHRASVVVSGRLGWNGRYWATAPGVHEPCPGGDYQTDPPRPGSRVCDRVEASVDPGALPAAGGLGESIRGLGPPSPPPEVERTAGVDRTLSGLLPFVVASAAGGKLGPDGQSASEPASKGFWSGYTVVRVPRSGDPRAVIVEQRPVFEWISLTAQEHVLRPGQRMTLRGYGREPSGFDFGNGSPMSVRYDRIDSPAITHRYDLVLADPERPWLPKVDPASTEPHGYVPLPPDIGMVDSQTGRVTTGRGNHPRTFAIGVLSVGDHVATWPLAFEPRRSFRPKPAAALPALPLPKVAATAAAALQSPQAPPPVNPPTPQVDLPVPPTIPSLPTPSANPPAPPAPPAPPPPPVSPQATPLDLVTSPLGLNIAPQATVIPPPAPPIQPAPPGGARREARQRQAATQKSGADVGASEQQGEYGIDLADAPRGAEGAEMRRRERVRADGASVTVVSRGDQASAWSRGALYGGGMTALALALALGWTLARPRPRRRPPAVPAAARAWARRR